jgi:hypothetical protein
MDLGKVEKYQGKNNNTITCVGYTDIESRMGNTASYLFSGNVTNLLLSMEDKKEKKWVLDLNDPAVRSICVATNGESLPPYVPPTQAAAPVAAKKDDVKVVKTTEEIKKEYMRNALFTSAGAYYSFFI